mmetsp:Transcript_133972/g.232580  ORF Transcript_133972/g.232580 Transcript_133972/m.232580 type:complete len:86 (+) Transcript_133972:2585-2842(+)
MVAGSCQRTNSCNQTFHFGVVQGRGVFCVVRCWEKTKKQKEGMREISEPFKKDPSAAPMKDLRRPCNQTLTFTLEETPVCTFKVA